MSWTSFLNREKGQSHLSTTSTTAPLPSFLKSPIEIYTDWTVIKNCPTYIFDSIFSIFSRIVSKRNSINKIHKKNRIHNEICGYKYVIAIGPSSVMALSDTNPIKGNVSNGLSYKSTKLDSKTG